MEEDGVSIPGARGGGRGAGAGGGGGGSRRRVLVLSGKPVGTARGRGKRRPFPPHPEPLAPGLTLRFSRPYHYMPPQLQPESTSTMLARTTVLLVALGTFAVPAPKRAPIAPGLLSGLVWRNLGPFRGGRISAVSGVVGQPGTFYIGLPLGGLWKTTSAGETSTPILDGLTPVSSVGAVAVAPSDPNVVYVAMASALNFSNDSNPLSQSPAAAHT